MMPSEKKSTESEPFSWSTIKPPVVALAPMSGVSDIAMRVMAKRFGSDLLFSEFISAASIFYKEENEKSFMLARFLPEERPFIIQLFGNDPEHFKVAARVLTEKFHPDGFDVNFGCPAPLCGELWRWIVPVHAARSGAQNYRGSERIERWPANVNKAACSVQARFCA